MLRYKLFKVKNGKLDALKAWASELKRRGPEVLDTLRYENVATETFYLFQIGDDWYAMGMQEVSGKHKKANMSVELNKRHFEVLKECLEEYNGEMLYEFKK